MDELKKCPPEIVREILKELGNADLGDFLTAFEDEPKLRDCAMQVMKKYPSPKFARWRPRPCSQCSNVFSTDQFLNILCYKCYLEHSTGKNYVGNHKKQKTGVGIFGVTRNHALN